MNASTETVQNPRSEGYQGGPLSGSHDWHPAKLCVFFFSQTSSFRIIIIFLLS